MTVLLQCKSPVLAGATGCALDLSSKDLTEYTGKV